MKPGWWMIFWGVWLSGAVLAQTPADSMTGNAAAMPAGTEEAEETEGAEARARPDFRDTSRYRFPAVADTVHHLQMMSYAMQLREYCANLRVSDDFVRNRLARFSQLTGREEDCNSLADYWN